MLFNSLIFLHTPDWQGDLLAIFAEILCHGEFLMLLLAGKNGKIKLLCDICIPCQNDERRLT
jgi:hypothetical protein